MFSTHPQNVGRKTIPLHLLLKCGRGLLSLGAGYTWDKRAKWDVQMKHATGTDNNNNNNNNNGIPKPVGRRYGVGHYLRRI